MPKRTGASRTFPGRLRISRIFGSNVRGSDHEYIIEIGDAETGAVVVAKMGGETLASAITGQAEADVQVDWRFLETLGLKYEHKTEPVYHPEFGVPEGDEAEFLAPHEVDGWRARESDIHNPHRHGRDPKKGDFHSVVFTRYVDPETGEGVEF